MAFVATPSATVVDQTTLMKKYLQFVAALTDNNTREYTDHTIMPGPLIDVGVTSSNTRLSPPSRARW